MKRRRMLGEGVDEEEKDAGRRSLWKGEGCRETELMERRRMLGGGDNGKKKDAGRRSG